MSAELVAEGRDDLSRIARVLLRLTAKLDRSLDDGRRDAELFGCIHGPHPFPALRSGARDAGKVPPMLFVGALEPPDEPRLDHAPAVVDVRDLYEVQVERRRP